MKIATWNVNSILARLPHVTRWLEAAQPDVLCIQETKCADDKFPQLELQATGYDCVIFGQQAYNGVAILSRAGCAGVQRGYPGDEATSQSRLLAVDVAGVRVINVYIPNGQAVGSEKYRFKLEWLRRLREFLDQSYDASSQVLICGDFNVAPEDRDVHDPRLWQNRVLCSEPERAALQHVKAWGFTDTFRLHNEEAGHYSWWDYRAGGFRRNLGLRIDHVWVSAPLAKRSRATWIDKEPRAWERPSDHAPVVAEFD
ncbi:MAG TPA: exodeoxyribonuclease III [Pyrinomonadaceae bacterium]|nr:exodeoxyribonuclease III [Pyrinomonadaceae bacterium]